VKGTNELFVAFLALAFGIAVFYGVVLGGV
jgi:hypothetical protein